MSTQTPDAVKAGGSQPSISPTQASEPNRFWAGRSELIVPALVLALAGFLTWQTATMQVLGSSVPGPQFFPTIVCVLLYAVVIAHTVQILRSPRGLDESTSESDQNAGHTMYSDWKTVGMVVGGVAGFILLLPVAGWIISAAALFWVVARALGSKRALFDVSIAVLFSSVIQLAFNAGLGLNLPSGFLEGLL